MNKDFNQSYWEVRQYFGQYDLIVIGAGIVGLSTAISFSQKNKKAKVLLLERGVFPEGASTKNAGFACFGSAGEILDDLKNAKDPDSVWETLRMRWEGLRSLRKRIGDKALDYKAYGGFELFKNEEGYEEILEYVPDLNRKIKAITQIAVCYRPSKRTLRTFKGFMGAIHNCGEGQIDTGKMMTALETLARRMGIRILYGIEVTKIKDGLQGAELETTQGVFHSARCVVATNGFARQLLRLLPLRPARAQVLLTQEIPSLRIKGSFHFDQGYYYFRNVDRRILLGGGRNLDFKEEETSEFGLNPMIQKELEKNLRNHILPGIPFQIEQRWSGIMGVGSEKKPIVQWVSPNVVAAVRMGGMGIAIGSKVGQMASHLLEGA